MHARIRPEPGGLPDLKQVARQMLARAREDVKALEASAEHEPDGRDAVVQVLDHGQRRAAGVQPAAGPRPASRALARWLEP